MRLLVGSLQIINTISWMTSRPAISTATTLSTNNYNNNNILNKKVRKSSNDDGGTSSNMIDNSLSSVPVESSSLSSLPSEEDPLSIHWEVYPNTYVAYKSPFIGTKNESFINYIDGNVLTKEIWQKIPWSESFDDIQGNDGPIHPTYKPGETKFKCMYDDNYLYIGAVVYPSANLSTQAHYTVRNSPIFQKDSDFEIFIDVYGSTHQYKELEINAINTVWNLLLNKPYKDGGTEHSGRITNNTNDPNYYEVYNQKTATQVLSGVLNDPNDQYGALWSVEFALAYTDLYATTKIATPPPSPTEKETNSHNSAQRYEKDNENKNINNNNVKQPQPPPQPPPLQQRQQQQPKLGDYWRINFSRVEKQGDINWTWQPQIVYDPVTRSYKGMIDMHLPDAWGYIYFAGDVACNDNDNNNNMNVNMINSHDNSKNHKSTDPTVPWDITWPAKLTAMTIYYALHYYKDTNGSYTDRIDKLNVPTDIINPFHIQIDLLMDTNNNKNKNNNTLSNFMVTVTSKSSYWSSSERIWATVQTERLLKAGITILPTTLESRQTQ